MLAINTVPPSDYLVADKGYDSNALRSWLIERGTTPVIPSKSNRKVSSGMAFSRPSSSRSDDAPSPSEQYAPERVRRKMGGTASIFGRARRWFRRSRFLVRLWARFHAGIAWAALRGASFLFPIVGHASLSYSGTETDTRPDRREKAAPASASACWSL
jgi:hypothetical protein